MSEAARFGQGLAHTLAETLRHHEEATSDGRTAQAVKTVHHVLEELEGATTEQVRAFGQALLESDAFPAELRPMMELIAGPQHPFIGVVQQLFMWGVLVQAVTGVLEPFMNELTNDLWEKNPSRVLSPEIVAQIRQRLLQPNVETEKEAAKGGVNLERLEALEEWSSRGLPDAQLAELWRRGHLSEEEFHFGLRWNGLREVDVKRAELLARTVPSIGEVMNAWLEGQISETEARERYDEAGGDPTFFQQYYDTNGTAPTPVELGVAWKRGYIPDKGQGPEVLSFEQGFLEGPWRNKWMSVMERLAEYLPPPRTITAMFRAGQLTRDQALGLFRQHGLNPELAAAYVNEASTLKVSSAKQLAVATIGKLLEDQIVTGQEAQALYEQAGYHGQEAVYMREVAELSATQKIETAAITVIGTEYRNHAIDEAEASSALDKLRIPAASRDKYLQTWQVERNVRSHTLTAAQVGGLYKKGHIDMKEATERWNKIGYSQTDAVLLLKEYEGASKIAPKLTIGEVGAGIKKGLVTADEAGKIWAEHGYNPAEVAFLKAYYGATYNPKTGTYTSGSGAAHGTAPLA
jgi:hypothetical protein